MMNYVIAGAEESNLRFPVETFFEAVRSRWGQAVVSVGWALDGCLVANIQPEDSPGFSIRLEPDGSSISPDGNPDQIAAVALWAITLLPDDHERLVLYDANGMRELLDGMSSTEVWSGWGSF